MSLGETDGIAEQEEEVLLEELREVADIDEDSGSVVVFASPSETSALGREMIQVVGGWLLHRRRERRARAAGSTSGGQTNLTPGSNMAM